MGIKRRIIVDIYDETPDILAVAHVKLILSENAYLDGEKHYGIGISTMAPNTILADIECGQYGPIFKVWTHNKK